MLLGIVLPDGRIAFASDKIVLSEQFVQIAKEGRSPEKRFRFSGKCVKSGCKQWTGKRCGVVDTLIEESEARSQPTDLPECSIRSQCRWFHQRGPSACVICPEVITDLRD